MERVEPFILGMVDALQRLNVARKIGTGSAHPENRNEPMNALAMLAAIRVPSEPQRL